jgi:hypothetical protein
MRGYQPGYTGVFRGKDEADVTEGSHRLVVERAISQSSSANCETVSLDLIFKPGHSYLIGSKVWRYTVFTIEYDFFVEDETDHVKTMYGGPDAGKTLPADQGK